MTTDPAGTAPKRTRWGLRVLALLRTLALAPLLALGPALAWAQISLQSVSSSVQGGVEVVRIEFSQPLASPPAGFAVQTPPRIALDFTGVSNALSSGQVEVNQGNLRTVTVAEAGERTRVVLNLVRPSAYQTRIDGKALLVRLEAADVPAVAAAAGPAGATAFASAAGRATGAATGGAASPQALREIDFRRAAEGTGRIIVTLPSPDTVVDIRNQGQNLALEFLRVSLPENLRRRLDVTDFGTPVQAVSTVQNGDRVRMLVEARGAWEHSAYQTDNEFVLEVRPVRSDPNRLTQGSGYSGERLSLNFQNIEVRSLLQVVADFTNFNVVTSDSVTGSLTLRLKDVPWDQALDIILQSKGLGVRKNGNVLLVAPKEELNAKDQAELEARNKLADLEPLRTQSFQLNYSKAETLARALGGGSGGGGAASSAGGGGSQGLGRTLGGTGLGLGGAAAGGGSQAPARILSARGSVIAEVRTNQLFVTDIASKLEQVQELIAKVDVPVRQVLIEARIVEADDTFGRALGVKLGGNDLRGVQGGVPGYSMGGGNYLAFGNNYSSLVTQTGQGGGGSSSFSDPAFVSLPANTTTLGTAAATFALSLFSPSANRFLNLELSALEAEGKGKVVSSPRVIVADQDTALIEQGEELPFQNATSSGATAVSFKKANLRLEVVPQITPEGNVILDVVVNKDSVGRTTPSGFAIDTKHAKTKVMVQNGGTVVIGGIYIQSEKNEVNKVPLLGDVPYLGHLFKNTARTVSKTELLIFITPKIVTDGTVAR
ncbi:MAG: type IV pilus secretin PilQ [Rubrivivax sp.]|jgi:type IV pilus assembly protein PilQ|nr:type IV pilus secretin PilQ [Rubrivivax sp.]